jgi:hypothetical protein
LNCLAEKKRKEKKKPGSLVAGFFLFQAEELESVPQNARREAET